MIAVIKNVLSVDRFDRDVNNQPLIQAISDLARKMRDFSATFVDFLGFFNAVELIRDQLSPEEERNFEEVIKYCRKLIRSFFHKSKIEIRLGFGNRPKTQRFTQIM